MLACQLQSGSVLCAESAGGVVRSLVLFVFVRVYCLYLFSDHAAVLVR